MILAHRLVDLRVALRDEEDPLLGRAERDLERADRGLAADDEGRHHVREDDHVPQRHERKGLRVVASSERRVSLRRGTAQPGLAAAMVTGLRARSARTVSSGDDALLDLVAADGIVYITSSISSSRMIRRPRAPTLRFERLLGDRLAGRRRRSAARRSRTRTSSGTARPGEFFGSLRMRDQRLLVELARASPPPARRPTNSGIIPNLMRSSGCTFSSGFRFDFSFFDSISAPKPIVFSVRRCSMMLLEADERAAADEEDVRRVDLDELLVRVLAPALRRHVGDRPLEDLEQRLLHALARDVAGDRRVLALARDLVDLVDVDDAALGLLLVVARRLVELEDDVLDVLADVAGLGQGRGVGDRERDGEHPRQRLGEQRLAGAGRPDQEDVRLLELDVAASRSLLGELDALVVVVDRDRELLLGQLLADDVLVEQLLDLVRLRELGLLLLLEDPVLRDDVEADVDALVADEDRRTGDQLLDVALALVAERTPEGVVAGFFLGHLSSGIASRRPARWLAIPTATTNSIYAAIPSPGSGRFRSVKIAGKSYQRRRSAPARPRRRPGREARAASARPGERLSRGRRSACGAA